MEKREFRQFFGRLVTLSGRCYRVDCIAGGNGGLFDDGWSERICGPPTCCKPHDGVWSVALIDYFVRFDVVHVTKQVGKALAL